MSKAVYVARKPCADCGYIMRDVNKRTRFCRRCVGQHVAAANRSPEKRERQRRIQQEREIAALAQTLDALFATYPERSL